MSRRRPSVQRRGALHAWTLHYGPSMTPMVDVVMVVLVFFMASAAFVGPEWFLAAALPPPAGRGAPAPEEADPFALPPVLLAIELARVDGATVATGLERSGAPLEEVLAALRSFAARTDPAQVRVMLDPGAEVPYADVVRVHEACAEAGIGTVGLR